MISIVHCVNVIHYIPHLIRANQSRSTEYINSGKKLEVQRVFVGNSCLASWWNWFPMIFGWIGDIWYRWNEMVHGCKCKWEFERQYDIFGWKMGATNSKSIMPDGECCVESEVHKSIEGVQNEMEECQSRQRRTNGDWRVPIAAAKHPKKPRRSSGECMEYRMQLRCANPGRVAPMRNKEYQSQSRQAEKWGKLDGMQFMRVNPGWEALV